MDRRTTDITAIGGEILAALDGARQIVPFSARGAELPLADAYRVSHWLERARAVRGETSVGRKIGFTNRNIWAEYNVDTPNWGYVTTRSLRELAGTPVLPLAAYLEPRIEPEIMFGLARAPSPGMDELALMNCIAWIAHGYEIVQSIFPQWKFTATDTTAANAMHGALLVGERRPVGDDGATWLDALGRFEVALYRDGGLIDRGRGDAVLGNPVSALRHLVGLLARDPHNPPLQAGEIVSTGTVTRAFPVAPGETWTTQITGLPLPGVSLTFS
ncbi:MAG TPA: hydratase [Pseudolabrys sp.]|nr:hydratase [Pseudolabrys sp.]